MLTRMVSISWPRDPPASASQSAGITGLSHRARPIFFFFFSRHRFLCVCQAGPEIPTSGDPPASASQNAGITGVSHCTWHCVSFFLVPSTACFSPSSFYLLQQATRTFKESLIFFLCFKNELDHFLIYVFERESHSVTQAGVSGMIIVYCRFELLGSSDPPCPSLLSSCYYRHTPPYPANFLF